MKDLFDKLGVVPKDTTLYTKAFSHSSYVNENNMKQDYERLEFLGDAVIDLIISDYLYNFKFEEEGRMTKIRSEYVCENALSSYSCDLNLSNYIKVGHGEMLSGGMFKKAIMADIFEALFGAIYLDLGYSTAKRALLKVIVPYIENPDITFFDDYKSKLQEFVQTEKRNLKYELIEEVGPSHNKKFTVQVSVDNIVFGVGTAKTKKEAEQEAAKSAISKLAVNKKK